MRVEKSKVIRLVDYLTRLALLRTKIIRDVSEYQNVLWIKDIPRQKGCFTQAWGPDEDSDSDVWIEVQTQREPELPGVPAFCKDWADKSLLRNKTDLPKLLPKIIRQVKNPLWHEGSDQQELAPHTEHLNDHPEIQREWEHYVKERWRAWVEAHNNWESVHKVYSKLFAIHQEQLRLGEEYEFVLAFGLLTWQTPSNQRVHRHLIVANAVLEFAAHLGKFTVRPLPAGASVRPELDMLDIEEQPARAEEMAKSSLANAGDDPWEKDCIEGVLQALVRSINALGEYDGALEAKNARASDKPIVEYAPALILRKRSARGLTETLKRIKDRIEDGGDIPGEFRDLAEIRSGSETNSENDPGETNSDFDEEVFFPKPSNEEQRRIVEKIRVASGVLVQGPPGTGKSHTIANLICHLLATGQRILVTAKTPRALQVLMGEPDEKGDEKDETDKGLIHKEIRPLCISLLGSGPEEKRSLESSVGGILRKNEEWNEEQATKERKDLEQGLRELREEKARTDRRLWSIREAETHTHTIAEGAYRGTAARIADGVNRDRSTYEWFTDTIPLDQACPISESDLRSMLAALHRSTPEKRRELSLTWPDDLPSPEKVSNLFEREESAIEEEARSIRGADEQIADQLSRIDVAAIEAIRDSLSAFLGEYTRLSASPHAWMCDTLRDVTGGNPSMWRELHRVTRDTIASIEPLAHVADETSIDFPNETNIRILLEDVYQLKKHLKNGGKLGWGPFRPKLVKECIHVLKTVRVNGRSCSSLEQLSILADALRVRVELEKAWRSWAGWCDKPQGPYTLQLHALKAVCDNLNKVLFLEERIGQCHEALRHCPHLGEPIWADELQIERLIASCRFALARYKKRLAIEDIRDIEASLSQLIVRRDVHPLVAELLQAIHKRDVEGFSRAWRKIEDLKIERLHVQKLDDDIRKLRIYVPKLTAELEQTCDDSCWDTRIQQIQGAWHWTQARFWIEEYIRKEDAPSLAKRAKQIEDEINATIAKLASLHAWSFCCSKLKKNESYLRHMEAWRKHVSSLTKTGTGKRDFRNRQAAQRSLTECKDAVPAWVMPLHRVWETVDPVPGMFDVVIVDEASQCGLEALLLFYLGKKVIIVGDDKQISPGGEFQGTAPINQLLDEYLHDFQFKEYFDVNVSLFDHGKLRYGTHRITLREHFRCMPEIIRFSNDLCYSDTPLIPLRQYGPDRLTPLEHVFVSGGYREGSNNNVVNRPEANAIVEKIVELCADKRYSGKTMGVVILQGEAQAGLIEGQLLERLGAEEMERRRLLCGNPDSFQGDERDIMFLSMVAASNERIGPLTKAADERRFNVAASRARDQMFLFHSVRSEDLSTSCLRRRLLEFFENTKLREIAGINREELERRAWQDKRSVVKPPTPFDSWFEVDVALELVRKGFNVLPQYEIARKRIDLVVEGGKARLAVECNGDEWHGADRYEADMQRQRQLERCGWEFFLVRESAFYSNKEGALQGLWRALEAKGISPGTAGERQESEPDENEKDYNDYNEAEDDGEESDLVSPSADDFGGADSHSVKRLGSGPVFDEETYAQAKPYFQKALTEFQAAGKSVKDYVRFLLDNFSEGIIPYLKRFQEELRVQRASQDIEPDHSVPEPTDAGDESPPNLAKHGVRASKEVAEGLFQLFGGKNRLGSGPTFDEETYQKAKPHFQQLWRDAQAAGLDLRTFVRIVLDSFSAKIAPYLKKFLHDTKAALTQPAAAEEPATSAALASQQVANWVLARIRAGQPFTNQQLFDQADIAFGGTQGQGTYESKAAYDAMEMGVNQWIAQRGFNKPGVPATVGEQLKELQRTLALLPTQSRRTAEQGEFQQFSTPPTEAYVASWVANLSANDTVLEPSAGVGGLAIFAKNVGAQVVVNELSPRRAALLRQMGFDQVYTENAEQLHNILPADVRPTVILMNPPFSATAGRMQGQRKTENAIAHIEQALKRLEPDGRLVAIVGQGMNDSAPAFRDWWQKIKGQYRVRANISIPGKEYAKYGTTFGNQLIVIDNVGPTFHNETKTGEPTSLLEALSLLEGVRNDRPVIARSRSGKPLTDQPTRETAPTPSRGEPRREQSVYPPAPLMGGGERRRVATPKIPGRPSGLPGDALETQTEDRVPVPPSLPGIPTRGATDRGGRVAGEGRGESRETPLTGAPIGDNGAEQPTRGGLAESTASTQPDAAGVAPAELT